VKDRKEERKKRKTHIRLSISRPDSTPKTKAENGNNAKRRRKEAVAFVCVIAPDLIIGKFSGFSTKYRTSH